MSLGLGTWDRGYNLLRSSPNLEPVWGLGSEERERAATLPNSTSPSNGIKLFMCCSLFLLLCFHLFFPFRFSS